MSDKMRLNITIQCDRPTVGFVAEALASIAGGTVVSTVTAYDGANDLAIIE